MLIQGLHNEQELLHLIREGDEAAFAALFHHYRNGLYTLALKLSGSTIMAEEAVQDVFLKIWLKRADLHEVQNFSGYLYVMVQNTMYRVLKQSANRPEQSMELIGEPLACTTDVVVDKEYHSILQKGIEKLPTQQRKVFQLVREKGLKRTEVAQLLQIDPETVKFHLSKAMKNLWNYCRLHMHLFVGFTFVASCLGSFLFK